MKTPEEIKKGMRLHGGNTNCKGLCPYEGEGQLNVHCIHALMKDGVQYMELLETSYSQVSKALCGKENATLEEILQAVDQLKSRLAQVERERDAAVADLEEAVDGHCCHCKNIDIAEKCDFNGECYDCPNEDCPCHEFNCRWEWRGVCAENTKEE